MIDKYAHCVRCEKNMLETQFVDGKIQPRLSPDYREAQYLLDDGTKMRVALCIQCKAGLTVEDEPEIMDCVYNGWVEETKALKWGKEKREKYLKEYKKRKIICRSEDLADDVLKKKLKKEK